MKRLLNRSQHPPFRKRVRFCFTVLGFSLREECAIPRITQKLFLEEKKNVEQSMRAVLHCVQIVSHIGYRNL